MITDVFKTISVSLIMLIGLSSALRCQDSLVVVTDENLQESVTNNFTTIVLGDRIFTNLGKSVNGQFYITVNGEEKKLDVRNGRGELSSSISGSGLYHFKWPNQNGFTHHLYHYSKSDDGVVRWRHLPLWLSILPPLIAIFLALMFKEVITSLFIGVWAGAFIAAGLHFGSFMSYFKSLWNVVDKYIIAALSDSGHLSVIVFSLMIGGMVALISRNGGMAGVVQSLSKYAKGERSSQFITWLLGLAIFFDDYANILIVGNTMRSVTDKFNISREKLAYIVDSTAAPISAIAFITTWIGAELGYIDSGIAQLENFTSNATAYSIFLSSLKYSFYPILTLVFILLLIRSKKDFGPMHKAEKRARTTGQVSPAATLAEDEPNMEDLTPLKGIVLNPINALLPVLTVIFMTIYGLLYTGFESSYSDLVSSGTLVSSSSWSHIWSALDAGGEGGFFMKLGVIIGSADSYLALLWASLSGLIIAIILTMRTRVVKLIECMDIMVTGFKTMMPALIILTFAWALAHITGELHTADFITSAIQGSISPYAMPAIVFVLAALTAFSTGSSWSTMAILYPIVIPATWILCTQNGFESDISMEILLNVISVTLAASVLGDHCSPISDTTILSSLATDCNHIDHVKTQMPYALLVGFFSLVCGFLATYLGGGILISFILLLISIAALFVIIEKVGKPIHEHT